MPRSPLHFINSDLLAVREQSEPKRSARCLQQFESQSFVKIVADKCADVFGKAVRTEQYVVIGCKNGGQIEQFADDLQKLVMAAVCCWIQYGIDCGVCGGTSLIDLKGIQTARLQRVHSISTPGSIQHTLS